MLTEAKDVIVTGLGFGDEGKGASVGFISHSRPVSCVVKVNGGAQAAHNVVADGVHHTFSQFGSGTLSGADTYLAEKFLVEPISLAQEAEKLAALGVSRPLSRMFINPDCLITTLYHVAANRARTKFGSCGRGIGETVWHAIVSRRMIVRAGDMVENLEVPSTVVAPPITMRDCANRLTLIGKLTAIRDFYAPLVQIKETPTELADLYYEFFRAVQVRSTEWLTSFRHLVFECAQGVLLDEWKGFHPYTTWSTTTPRNAQNILERLGRPPGYVLGVLRTYHTRHGAGPFPSENANIQHAEPHNKTGKYQGPWRQGYFDNLLARYAVAVAKPDGIALTHTDRLTNMVSAYQLSGAQVDKIPLPAQRDLKRQEILTALLQRAEPVIDYHLATPARVQDLLGVPVVLTADGPDRKNRTLTL